MNTVDIVELEFGDEITLFPNPTRSEFKVNLGGNIGRANIKISDAKGKLVHRSEHENQRTVNIMLNERPGVYFVEISSGDKFTVKRLILN